jgi:hypothetical protein
LVPEDFNSELSKVRGLRITADQSNKFRDLFNENSLSRVSPEGAALADLNDFVSANGKPEQIVRELLTDSRWSREAVASALGRKSIPANASLLTVKDLSEEISRVQAQRALSESKLRYQLLPEDVPSLLRTLPTSSLVKRVALLNETSMPYCVENARKLAQDLPPGKLVPPIAFLSSYVSVLS